MPHLTGRANSRAPLTPAISPRVIGVPLLAQCLSRLGQLQPLRRVDAVSSHLLVGLPSLSSTRKNLSRPVLWLQAAPGCQRATAPARRCSTPGDTDDRTPVSQLLQRLFDKVFGDRGYVSQKLALRLWQESGIQLITKLRRNMKNRLIPLTNKPLLRRRAIIESIIDQLKNISQIEHSRQPFPVNAFVDVISELFAYCHRSKKLSLFN